MNDRQVKCFLEVCRQMNFTKAAEKLFLPQPAVSRYISSLEKELGTKLFIRKNSRTLYLSDDGKSFYNMFLRFHTELGSKLDEIHSDIKPIRLGYSSGWNLSAFLPGVIERCQERNKDFKIEISCMNFDELISALVSRKLDAALEIENYCQAMPEISMARIGEINRVIVYSKRKYPDVKRPADFYDEDFFLMDDPQIRKIAGSIEVMCSPFGFVPRLKTVKNIETVIACVENGLGVAFLDEWANGISNPEIGHMEIGSIHDISLVWLTGNYSNELKIFNEEVERELEK